MKKILVLISTFLFLFSFSAFGSVCVELDLTKDKLSENDQEAAKAFLESILEKSGKTIDENNCRERYVLYHLTLGDSVTAFIKSPKGSRSLQVLEVEELPRAYEQMLSSLEKGSDMASSENAKRNNVTPDQANPRRIKSDALWYARLGYGYLANDEESGAGVSIGLGYRYELDHMAVDISSLNVVIDNKSSENQFDFSLIRIGGLYFLSPLEDASPYIGAAISYGATGEFTGWGMRGETFAGYEMLRTSDIRMFIEGNAIFPFFKSEGIKNRHEEEWVPAFTISLGVGF